MIIINLVLFALVTACTIKSDPDCSTTPTNNTTCTQTTTTTTSAVAPTSTPAQAPAPPATTPVHAATTGPAITVRSPISSPAPLPNVTPLPPPQKTPGPKDHAGYLRGYIESAFTIRVNGISYNDSEQAYTAELAHLLSEASRAGYGGYRLEYEAQMGLGDLSSNMLVFVQAEGTGFSGRTKVGFDGQFLIEVPNGGGSRFDIKTAKRVSVILTSADAEHQIKWCYNLFGIANGVTTENPFTIDTFVTELTAYECLAEGTSVVPPNPKLSAPSKN